MRSHVIRDHTPAKRVFACFAICLSVGGWLPLRTCCAQDKLGHVAIPSKHSKMFPKYSNFARTWKDGQWIPREARRFPRHIRDLADTGWRLRMLAMHEVVSAGETAVPFLLERLSSGATHERIFAAQTLGFLAEHAPAEPLLEALSHDSVAAVQLYAADALGMRGDDQLPRRFEELTGRIQNRDVRRHMSYAEQRNGAAVEKAIVEKLAKWNPKNLDSAEKGNLAPDFELATVGGDRTVKLSDYRGKKNVVLVFIYGDT